MNNETALENPRVEKWQKINALSKEDYGDMITDELKEIYKLIEQLDLSSDIPNLPKIMLFREANEFRNLKNILASFVKLAKRNKVSGKDVSHLIH